MKIIRVGRHITLDFRSERAGRDSKFSELSSKLAGQPGVTDPDALAAWIGQKKYGAAGMAAKSAAGRTGDDELGVPDHGFLPETSHPMSCMLCGAIKSSHETKDDWSPEAREAAIAARKKANPGRGVSERAPSRGAGESEARSEGHKAKALEHLRAIANPSEEDIEEAVSRAQPDWSSGALHEQVVEQVKKHLSGGASETRPIPGKDFPALESFKVDPQGRSGNKYEQQWDATENDPKARAALLLHTKLQWEAAAKARAGRTGDDFEGEAVARRPTTVSFPRTNTR
jgi:hypothetical protein